MLFVHTRRYHSGVAKGETVFSVPGLLDLDGAIYLEWEDGSLLALRPAKSSPGTGGTGTGGTKSSPGTGGNPPVVFDGSAGASLSRAPSCGTYTSRRT